MPAVEVPKRDATPVEAVVDGPTDLDVVIEKQPSLRPLDPSRLQIIRNENPSTLPADMQFKWGAHFTDHMLILEHDETEGWSDPIIKPYGKIALDPASTVFHYAPALFEGMKAYKAATPGSPPVLFRPDLNMARMRRSADRVQLPDFDPEALTSLIKTLVKLDEHLIPPPPNALYIRPTMIGTRPTLGVAPSTHCMLYVICCPVGPFFPTKPSVPLSNGAVENVHHVNGQSSSVSSSSSPSPAAVKKSYSSIFTPVSLLATESATRAWPGGVGEYKLAGNYAPCFKPQLLALKKGYQQNLWCLQGRLTECGQMNLFVVFGKKNGDRTEVEVATPSLDGTILPGVTRDSVLAVLREHAQAASNGSRLPDIPESYVVRVSERQITLEEFVEKAQAGEVLEVFGTGTAAVISPIKRVGLEDGRPDIHVPEYDGGLGPIARASFERLSQIQEGAIPDHPWTVKC